MSYTDGWMRNDRRTLFFLPFLHFCCCAQPFRVFHFTPFSSFQQFQFITHLPLFQYSTYFIYFSLFYLFIPSHFTLSYRTFISDTSFTFTVTNDVRQKSNKFCIANKISCTSPSILLNLIESRSPLHPIFPSSSLLSLSTLPPSFLISPTFPLLILPCLSLTPLPSPPPSKPFFICV